MADADDDVLTDGRPRPKTYVFGKRRVPTAQDIGWGQAAATQVHTWRPPNAAQPAPTPAPQARPSETPPSDEEAPGASAAAQHTPADPAPREPSPRVQPPVDPDGAAPAQRPSSVWDAPPGQSERIPAGAKMYTEDELNKRLVDQRAALLEALRVPTLQAVRRLDLASHELERHIHEFVLDLATRLASKMVRRAIALDRTIVVDVAQRALRMAGPVEQAIVRCHPDDVQILRDVLSPIADEEAGRTVEVIVRPGHDIDPGGVLVTYESGIVDARVDRCLERLAEVVASALTVSDEDRAESRREEP